MSLNPYKIRLFCGKRVDKNTEKTSIFIITACVVVLFYWIVFKYNFVAIHKKIDPVLAGKHLLHQYHLRDATHIYFFGRAANIQVPSRNVFRKVKSC